MDPYRLQRFVDAQADAYERALAELKNGRKASHRMWFVFPQLAGLGRSPTAQFYGIGSIEEARLSRPSGARPTPRLLHRSRERPVRPYGTSDSRKSGRCEVPLQHDPFCRCLAFPLDIYKSTQEIFLRRGGCRDPFPAQPRKSERRKADHERVKAVPAGAFRRAASGKATAQTPRFARFPAGNGAATGRHMTDTSPL